MRSSAPPCLPRCAPDVVYVWLRSAPAGTVLVSPYSDRVRLVVVESGEERVGQGINVRRNVLEDYRRAFGDDPGDIVAVGVMTGSGDGGSTRRAFYGDITSRAMNEHSGFLILRAGSRCLPGGRRPSSPRWRRSFFGRSPGRSSAPTTPGSSWSTPRRIITFLMMFISQNTQNRDTEAIQLKRGELDTDSPELKDLRHGRTPPATTS